MLDYLRENKKQVNTIVSLAIFFLLLWYLYQNRNALEVLENITLGNALIISVCEVSIIILSTILNYSMIVKLNRHIIFFDTLLLQYANNFINKITSRGGIIFRGLYLKKMYNFDISKFLSTVAGVYIISFGINAIVGLISSFFIFNQVGVYSPIITLFLLCVALVMFLLIIFTPKFKSNNSYILRNLNKMIVGWVLLKKDGKRMILFISITFLIIFIAAFQQYVIYAGLGEQIDIWRILFLSSISNLSILVNITPGGIGIKEAILIFSSEVIGVSSEVLVLGSLVSRVLVFATSLVFGGLSYLLLIKKMKRNGSLPNNEK